MRLRRFLSAVLSLSLVAAPGCSSRPAPAPSAPPVPFYYPNVSLTDVKVAGIGLRGGSLEVALNIYNPNEYGLNAPRVAYRLYVERDLIADGVYDLSTAVAAQDTATLTVPVVLTFDKAAIAGRSMMNTGSVNYRVVGKMYVGTPYGRFGVPFDRAGLFSNMRPPVRGF